MTLIQQHLAANMKQLRKKLGFSQSQLAEKAGTSTNYIAMIETCKKFPSPSMLERLACALQVASPELFSQNGIRLNEAEELQDSLLSAINAAVCAVLAERLKDDGVKDSEKI